MLRASHEKENRRCSLADKVDNTVWGAGGHSIIMTYRADMCCRRVRKWRRGDWIGDDDQIKFNCNFINRWSSARRHSENRIPIHPTTIRQNRDRVACLNDLLPWLPYGNCEFGRDTFNTLRDRIVRSDSVAYVNGFSRVQRTRSEHPSLWKTNKLRSLPRYFAKRPDIARITFFFVPRRPYVVIPFN